MVVKGRRLHYSVHTSFTMRIATFNRIHFITRKTNEVHMACRQPSLTEDERTAKTQYAREDMLHNTCSPSLLHDALPPGNRMKRGSGRWWYVCTYVRTYMRIHQ